MQLINQIEIGIRTKPRRVLMYGPPGIGLSTFAATADKPIFIPTVEGLGHIGCPRFPTAQRFSKVLQALRELAVQRHDYRTVVIDTAEGLELLIWDEICSDRGLDNIADMSHGKGYFLALDYWRQVLDCLTTLSDDLDMTCLILGHAHTERIDDQVNGGRARQAPALHWRASALLQAWCDEVLFATHQATLPVPVSAVQKEDQGRVIVTVPTPANVGKNHLGLKAVMPMKYEAFAPYFSVSRTEVCSDN